MDMFTINLYFFPIISLKVKEKYKELETQTSESNKRTFSILRYQTRTCPAIHVETITQETNTAMQVKTIT